MKDIFGDDSQNGPKKDFFAEMLEQADKKISKKLSVGDRVQAEILSIGKEEVFVATGTTTDGIILKNELLEADGSFNHKVGDILDLYVTQLKKDFIKLSKKASQKDLSENLEDAFDFMLPVEGRITETCNGGFRVAIMGKTAFCPVGQIDSRYVEKPEEYVGKRFRFLITQYNGGRNIVLSRKKLLDQEREESTGAFLETHKVGAIVSGKVARLEKFGAFVEIAPGLDGLVHISEVSWSHLQDPSEVLSVGQDVLVKILKIEDLQGKMKISLSCKQAQDEPWGVVSEKFKVGDLVTGKVTRCAKFGAFVELLPGVEGLVPLSEMSYVKRIMKAEDVVKPGEQISVLIKDIQVTEKRMTLSIRDAEGDPWNHVKDKYPAGKVVQGKVERKEKYGLFINLEPGVTGLLPKSKISNSGLDTNVENKKIGDTLVVQIDELNLNERKISLGLPKDPEDTSWKEFGGNSDRFGTFGDQFKDLFKNKK